jgi:hypothetical protein
MSFELFQEVALSRDLPDHKLKAGDVATIIEFVSGAKAAPGCVLEFFSAIGKTLTVVAVPISSIEPLQENEVRAVRRLAPTS